MTNVSHQNATVKKLPKYIETELGTEKLCIHCNEYWPLDSEFYFTYRNRHQPEKIYYEAACKCCYDLRYRPNRNKNKGVNTVKSYHERSTAA
ncbi:hypothetical protein BFG52_03790 [Acinetobacter larvae]|uniref:Uncharacterized protein n=1 Tax=Acinetobacter larvae TaxID=1789224 RepID=A0A1B2LXE6_9GAMM|nr:hypothetical protein BFG52_03790 [Acinetobacter larvae]